MWCIPGSFLPAGNGWKFWFSQSGLDDFKPELPKVYLCSCPSTGNPQKKINQPCTIDFDGECLPVIDGIKRRIYIANLSVEDGVSGAYYWIEFPYLTEPFILQLVPKQLPKEGISFLLNSCFWRYDDKAGKFAEGVKKVMQYVRPRPAFKLLIGDQIYLDYPLIVRNARQTILTRYLDYWSDPSYQKAMATCPNFFTCDDHEYWNNFPEPQLQLPYTYTEASRKEFYETADTCFWQFQGLLNPHKKTWYQIDIHPASIFAIDTRSRRSRYNDPHPQFMDEEQWLALESWQQNLKGPGILSVGQPIYQRDGDWKDYSLSNFKEDYGRLLTLIKRSFDGENLEGKRHDILVLTGDIHHGRHASGWLGEGQELHEFVSSSSSRIGPFLSEPKVEKLPSIINAKYKNKVITIKNIQAASSQSVELENQTSVVTLIPKANGGVEVDFSIYRVRPYTHPPWHVLSCIKDFISDKPAFQRSYSSSLCRKIILH